MEGDSGSESVADLVLQPLKMTCVMPIWRARCLDLNTDDLPPAEFDDDVNLVATLLLAQSDIRRDGIVVYGVDFADLLYDGTS